MGDQASQTSPNSGSVHVTAESGNLESGLDALSEALLGQTHEGLLHVLVSERSGVVQITELRSHFGESRVSGVGEVVVVQHTSEGLLHQLAGGGVVAEVVKTVQGSLGIVLGGAVGTVLDLLLQGLLTSIVGLVAGVDSLGVASEGEVAVHDGVLAGQVGLEEVVGVGDVGGTETRLEHNRGVGADQHGDTASTTGRASSTLGVQGNVTANNDGISAIPSRGLEPVDAVENSVGATVASIDVVNTLNVGVSVRSQKLHQDGLDGLGLVQQGLGTDLQTANGVGVDVVLAKKGGEGGQGNGVDVCRGVHVSIATRS